MADEVKNALNDFVRFAQALKGSSNFRNDVNHNGSINAGDVSICKQYSGTGIP